MTSFFRRSRAPQPFLAPLGVAARRRKLPAVVAPLAVTVIGGVALVALFGLLLGGEEAEVPTPPEAAAFDQPAQDPVAEPPAAAQIAPAPEEDAVETAADMPAEEPAADDQLPDPARTASILPALSDAGAIVPSVPVAETEAEIAALEELQRRELEEDAEASPAQEAASIPEEAAAPMRPAVATRYVNMRAGPDDDAEVLEVVPALAEIEAEEDCNWCAVSYQGRSGYIYRSFIDYR